MRVQKTLQTHFPIFHGEKDIFNEFKLLKPMSNNISEEVKLQFLEELTDNFQSLTIDHTMRGVSQFRKKITDNQPNKKRNKEINDKKAATPAKNEKLFTYNTTKSITC